MPVDLLLPGKKLLRAEFRAATIRTQSFSRKPPQCTLGAAGCGMAAC
jgi:hypothetical protein